MSRLTRDGTAEPVSRDQILRHARGQANIIFPVQLTTSRIGNLTRLIHTLLYVMTIHTLHTYIHTYCTTVLRGRRNNPQPTAPLYSSSHEQHLRFCTPARCYCRTEAFRYGWGGGGGGQESPLLSGGLSYRLSRLNHSHHSIIESIKEAVVRKTFVNPPNKATVFVCNMSPRVLARPSTNTPLGPCTTNPQSGFLKCPLLLVAQTPIHTRKPCPLSKEKPPRCGDLRASLLTSTVHQKPGVCVCVCVCLFWRISAVLVI